MSVRRFFLMIVGMFFGCLEVAFLRTMAEFSVATHFFVGLAVFVILQIVLWILSSVFKKDKGGAKLATLTYFWSYILYSFIGGLLMSIPFWSLVSEILVVFLISKIVPKIIYSIIYCRTRIFS